MAIDPKLLDYCETERQTEVLNTYLRQGSSAKTAEALGIGRRTVEQFVSRVKMAASKKGYAPNHWDDGVAAGYGMGKVTVHRKDGKVVETWERQHPLEIAAATLAECLENLKYKPAPRIKAPKKVTRKNELALYTITDFHLGMYAWAEETGEDWDTKIAAKVMLGAIQDMSLSAAGCEEAILNIQGDFLHWDGLDAVTPQNKHVLDADTRFGHMVELALDLVMWSVEVLLKHHKKVRLIVCEGNHDLAGSAWLGKAMKKIYAKTPRLTVDDTEFPYYAYLWGQTMLAFHHGHKKNDKSLPELFASEPRYREMWGSASYTYIHTGHLHNSKSDEFGGAIVERHPTLAARDAYATRGGYVSRRGCKVIIYDKIEGETDRFTKRPRA